LIELNWQDADMPSILRKLPFFTDPTTVVVRGKKVPIKADQIIVWASLSERRQTSLDLDWPRFPILLDTRHNHNVSIREEQLAEWAELDLRLLPKLGEIHVGGDRLTLVEADLWFHSNRSGSRDVAMDRPAYRMELYEGIAVAPRGRTSPLRLPLVGLRALRQAQLHDTIDCLSRHDTIRTPRRFWFL
jgi:hypothetical protein